MGILDSVKGVFYKSDKEYAEENPEFRQKLEQKQAATRRSDLEKHSREAEIKTAYTEAYQKAEIENARKRAEADVLGKMRGSGSAGTFRLGGLEIGSRVNMQPRVDSNKFGGQVLNDQAVIGWGGVVLRQNFSNYGKQARGFGGDSAFGGRSLFSLEPEKTPEQQVMERAFQEGFLTAKVNSMTKRGMNAYYQSVGVQSGRGRRK